MDITVAVCARNAEKYIADCLKSINSQTVKPTFIFVIDDHSTDATTEIARRLGAKVIVNDGHQLYDGRDTALKYCNTKILAFTDADCILDEKWVENIIHVLSTRDVVGGTGPHPAKGSKSFAGWIHHMWFNVECDLESGYIDGVIGGNCYFITDVIRREGGWISLPYSNAEDVYIAEKLKAAGYKLWFDKNIIAHHRYTNNFAKLMKKTVRAGEAITVMMRAAGIRTSVWRFALTILRVQGKGQTGVPGLIWWYTLTILIVAIMGIFSILSLFFSPTIGLILTGLVFGSTLFFFWYRLRSISETIPRYIARWILIWPYAWGILKGLIKKTV